MQRIADETWLVGWLVGEFLMLQQWVHKAKSTKAASYVAKCHRGVALRERSDANNEMQLAQPIKCFVISGVCFFFTF